MPRIQNREVQAAAKELGFSKLALYRVDNPDLPGSFYWCLSMGEPLSDHEDKGRRLIWLFDRRSFPSGKPEMYGVIAYELATLRLGRQRLPDSRSLVNVYQAGQQAREEEAAAAKVRLSAKVRA